MSEIIGALIGAAGVIVAAFIAAGFARRSASLPEFEDGEPTGAVVDAMTFSKILSAARASASGLEGLVSGSSPDLVKAARKSKEVLAVLRFNRKNFAREDRRYFANLVHLLKQARARADYRTFLQLLAETDKARHVKFDALRARGLLPPRDAEDRTG